MIDTYCNDDVTITAPSGSFDRQGNPAWGAPVAAKAWVQPRRRVVWTQDGQQKFSEAQVILPPSVSIGVGYRITYGGLTAEVVALDTQRDLDGPAQFVAYLGPLGPAS